jgi:pimeloyl-ACP methyl ester carboxylesterase
MSLYFEMKGAGGPTVLLIAGTTGDAGHYNRVAARLSQEFTVVTYDRRGNSRSPRPDGWATTTIPEQADDAAHLIESLRIGPAAVFASSLGAIIGLDLMQRYPHLLRGIILHEPPLFSALKNPQEPAEFIQSTVQKGMENGGGPGGVEAFLRVVIGDTFDRIDPEVRGRMLNNADVAFGVEGPLPMYQPDMAKLAANKVPVALMGSTGTAPFFTEALLWLAEHLRVQPTMLSEGHAPYFAQGDEMAETLRPMLRRYNA